MVNWLFSFNSITFRTKDFDVFSVEINRICSGFFITVFLGTVMKNPSVIKALFRFKKRVLFSWMFSRCCLTAIGSVFKASFKDKMLHSVAKQESFSEK